MQTPKKNRKKRCDLDMTLIIKMYCEDYLSLDKIGKVFGVTHHTIASRLMQSGIDTRKTRLRGKLSSQWKGYRDISARYWSQVKHSAKIRNIEFNISLEYVWELFEKQNKKCALSGEDIFFAERHCYENQTASLDRIDSSKPYIIGNVQWVHSDVNRMKSDLTEDRFIFLCSQISKNK